LDSPNLKLLKNPKDSPDVKRLTAHVEAEHTVAKQVEQESNDGQSKGGNQHTHSNLEVGGLVTIISLVVLGRTEINVRQKNKGSYDQNNDG